MSATRITFDLTSCHVTGGCGTQTVFGTVDLTQNGANVDFVVTLLGGKRFVETGAADDQLFKFNGATSAANITNEATANPLNAVAGGLNDSPGLSTGTALEISISGSRASSALTVMGDPRQPSRGSRLPLRLRRLLR